ncbi:MAG: ABC transporter ATP-binding protein [Coleofasciculus sp. G3-WIS-01]|uniref:ABC transporter ATP-binding protein n=1 Tax=Coleofasciculus sp. G3-WIS-01 TaxID=3069528 RepID=UPI0032F87942
MSEIAISLTNVSKCYRRYNRPLDRLKEIVLPGKSRAQEFWALRDINLEVAPGETLGIVGQNGSGKSTLLQIIAGTLTPTTGEVWVNGRVSALLELGSGFNPEFTGRQNVFFNGQILGLSREEIAAKFDSIAAFADIGDFLDQPVKTYSSGMVVRLAFAVVANIDPTILIVDEALAVGDARFQARCMKRIRQLKEQGVTILFVSHDSASVKMLCTRAALMNYGSIIDVGQPKEVINHYTALLSSDNPRNYQEILSPRERLEFNDCQPETSLNRTLPGLHEHRHGNQIAVINEVKIINIYNRQVETIETGSLFKIQVKLAVNAKLSDLVIGISIRNLMGLVIYGTNTQLLNCQLPQLDRGQELNVGFQLPCNLHKGIYTVTIGVHSQEGLSYDWIDDLVVFEVINGNHCEGIVDLQADVQIKADAVFCLTP